MTLNTLLWLKTGQCTQEAVVTGKSGNERGNARARHRHEAQHERYFFAQT